MEKILFVCLYEPSKYGGHTGGTVILPNDILNAVEENLDVDLLVYKKDQIKSILPANIHFKPWSKGAKQIKRISKLRNLPTVLSRDYSCFEIDTNQYTRIIYFPYFCALFKITNPSVKIYTIGMDSGPMLYLRGFNNQSKFVMKVFCFYEFLQSLRIDKIATSISEKVFTVGEPDAEFYRSVFQSKAYYVPHPVSSLVNNYTPIDWNGNEKLRLCLPGGMSRFYVANLLDQILNNIYSSADKYRNKIMISFLGRIRYKGLEKLLKKISRAGIEIKFTDFADDYEMYLSQQHVILLPLAVGAGTKNKALSAFSMGLDVIGTPTAMENVYGVKKENIAYNADDFMREIDRRIINKKLYGFDESTKIKFREYHSIQAWRNGFWKEILKN